MFQLQTPKYPCNKRFYDLLVDTPTKPGAYLMKDGSNSVLYVGKAKNLKSRIRSYFNPKSKLQPKIRNMVSKVESFEFIVTESEQEAILLECNLIKQHKPNYNARLKDDKTYPFIKIDNSQNFPLVNITRNVSMDEARYFGPFASAGSVRKTLKLLNKLFPYRSCTKIITGNDAKPCLDFHINLCAGPCIGAVNKNEYHEIIDQVILFLEGKTDKVVSSITNRMNTAADKLDFEKAAMFRDQIKAINSVNQKQRVLKLSSVNIDVIAMDQLSGDAWIEIFFVRQGKLVGRDNFLMSVTQDHKPAQIITAFVEQFYSKSPQVPDHILLQHPIENVENIKKWLTDKQQRKVKISVPKRGEKHRLLKMVIENAKQGLKHSSVKHSTSNDTSTALLEIQDALSLPRLPSRIECYDISNIQGTNSVGSMVVFESGNPKKSDYRRFKIKNNVGIDDYSMMREVLSRRFIRKQSSSKNPNTSENSNSWDYTPDLVLIDGGRGHLSAANQVFLEQGIKDVPLASLAKQNEEIFTPEYPDPVILPKNSQGLFLLQRARDEAHRFAITFHRNIRSKGSIVSALDNIHGIGPEKRKTLLRTFGSVNGIKKATVDEISLIPGITPRFAKMLKDKIQ